MKAPSAFGSTSEGGNMQSLGNILNGVPEHRSSEPVRRFSRLKGRETGFWRSTTRRDARQIVLAAKRFELETKQSGSRIGAIGSVAIEVLDYLANLVDYKTGRLDPSIDTLMTKLRRSRDAIVRALKALRQHGFLDWIRRYVPTGNEGRGPQVKQTSNAYRLLLPRAAKRLLGRYGKEVPVSADLAHQEAETAAELVRYKKMLSLSEFAHLECENDDLAAALGRLGEAVQRESVQRTESKSKIYNIGKVDKRTR